MRYKVEINPLIKADTYGDYIDISDYVQDGGIGKIKRGIDSTDFDFGLFTFSDITIKLENVNGKFNESGDDRSIFCYQRDLAKVRISLVFNEQTGLSDKRFDGIINEDGTKANAYQDEITFKILSLDSVLRKTKVESGVLTDGMLASSAFKILINRPQITILLNYDENLINPSLDIILDDVSSLEKGKTSSTINKILQVTNSVMLINDDNFVVVQDREPNLTVLRNFYGPYDIFYRENMTKMEKFNSGKHRTFTSVKVNNTEKSIEGYQQDFGFNQKEINAAFITNAETEGDIAEALANEFKMQKIEAEFRVPTIEFYETDILDLCRVYYPLRIKRIDGSFLPIIGITKINDDTWKLPNRYGSIEIRKDIAFKAISIEEDPKALEMIIKLRQVGNGVSDGYFSEVASSLIGLAVIGKAIIAGEGDLGDSYNPSVIGAAKIGLTKIA